ncbi:MAG: hypothetical protein HY526_13745 [Betaproteobacteria bacterium]|nr:hypothetical protein [Betaproteobacteria bacterium]
MQQTGKNAADFVDGKFARDYGTKTIELDAAGVTVDAFCRAGLSARF